jgi:hypothetical protein
MIPGELSLKKGLNGLKTGAALMGIFITFRISSLQMSVNAFWANFLH